MQLNKVQSLVEITHSIGIVRIEIPKNNCEAGKILRSKANENKTIPRQVQIKKRKRDTSSVTDNASRSQNTTEAFHSKIKLGKLKKK